MMCLAAPLLFSAGLFAAEKPNIILITLDSARADRMGFLGAKGRLTSQLDALAKESVVFEHAYAQSPRTLASHAALLTGTYPPYNH
ncbi:MAG TPA: sulfatase-like hydrolase/transferase, partial [Terriglobales bacterium]|nr:sulfatase-like hydrolase/transferase [Terriglobales bacterium]